MPQFRYQALNANQELVSGEVAAEDARGAIAELEARGLTVRSIELAALEPSEPESLENAARPADRPRPRGDASASPPESALLAQLSELLARGKAITPALRAFAQEAPSGRRRRELEAACRVIESGDAAQARRALAALPEFWIPLITSASASPDVGGVLREFLTASQHADELRRQWRQILAYPLFVAALAVAVLLLISFSVVPVIRKIFDEYGMQLPGFTRALLATTQWVASAEGLAAIAVVIVGGAVIGFRGLLSRRFGGAGRRGRLFGRSTSIAQFARFTADLLGAGMDGPTAARIAASTIESPKLQRAGWEVAQAMEDGAPSAAQPYKRSLTGTVVHALQGEMPTASRVRLLAEISSCYADRARRRLSWTQGVVGPLAICIVGTAVGAVVLALVLPLVVLINNLSG